MQSLPRVVLETEREAKPRPCLQMSPWSPWLHAPCAAGWADVRPASPHPLPPLGRRPPPGRMPGPCLTLCFSTSRRLTSSRSSSTRNAPTTTWKCTMAPTAGRPSSAASAAARSRTPWWLRAAACFLGFTRTPRCRGEGSRRSTAQVREPRACGPETEGGEGWEGTAFYLVVHVCGVR